MKAYQILAPLLMWGCAHAPTIVPTVNGRKQTVNYFFAPSCNACESTDAIIDRLERKFGDKIVLERVCGMSAANPNLDGRECRRLYAQDAQTGADFLVALGGSGFPAIYVNLKSVEPRKGAVCRELNLEEDCLD